MLFSVPAVINHNSQRQFCEKDRAVAEDEELTDVDWHTLCDTLRGSIAMFDMLLAECGDNSETARVVGDARRRREKVLNKIERRLQRERGD
jgi:hypothetical protein